MQEDVDDKETLHKETRADKMLLNSWHFGKDRSSDQKVQFS